MSESLRQSSATVVKLGPFVSATDGVTPQTGLSFGPADVRLAKNAAAFVARNASAAVAHDEQGYYDVPLDAIDTGTAGRLLMAAHLAGALPVWQECEVLPANVFDARFAGDRLEVDVREIDATLAANVAALVWDVLTAGHTAAGTFGEQVKVDIDQILLDAQALQLDWADGGRLDSLLDAVLDTLEADVLVDKTTDPQQWKLVLRRKGSAEVLLTKDLRDIDGVALASEATIVGGQVQA